MCGFAGFWPYSAERSSPDAVIARMTGAIAHRGPDDSGCHCDDATGVALGFRRLSILDLSPAGHQPMLSASGRYAITFNGEIYNFAALREQIGSGMTYRGHSDTEIILAAVERFGVVETIKRCAGMFAFALWDRQERTLYLTRDRLGEKPLYYGVFGGTLVWGSELKALRAHPAFRGTVDRASLALFLRHNYVPAPYSIYEGVNKVVPGTVAVFRDSARAPEIVTYWSPTCRSAPSSPAVWNRPRSSHSCRHRARRRCAPSPSASTKKRTTKLSTRRPSHDTSARITPSCT